MNKIHIIQYTMETENFEKSLQFLDLNITNINDRYEYKIHRKNAITNVQVKPNSGHDPKVLKEIFTGFLEPTPFVKVKTRKMILTFSLRVLLKMVTMKTN